MPGAASFLAHLRALNNVSISIATRGWYENAVLKQQSVGISIHNIPVASSDDHYCRIKIKKITEELEKIMSLEVWITYIFATTLILIIPGPTIILVVSQAVTHGRKSVVPLVAGVVFGDFTAMAFSLLGLGAIMAASASLFTLFKWIGALYLLYLGINLWRANPKSSSIQHEEDITPQSLFKSSFIVTALNPKGIAFFVAFLPQFISHHEPVFMQLLLLGGTFLLLALVNASLYALFASQLREAIKRTSVRKWFNRCGGTALIGAGILTASIQRS